MRSNEDRSRRFQELKKIVAYTGNTVLAVQLYPDKIAQVASVAVAKE